MQHSESRGGECYASGGGYYHMTAEETRRQKVDLTIQVEDSEKRLAHLREAARRRADQIISIGERLRNPPETDFYREGYSALDGQSVDRIRLLTDNQLEALDIRPAIEIANSIRKELRILADFRDRLSRL